MHMKVLDIYTMSVWTTLFLLLVLLGIEIKKSHFLLLQEMALDSFHIAKYNTNSLWAGKGVEK